MKKKLLSIMTILTALMALLMVTANAGDAVDPEPSAADGWRCTQAIYYVVDPDSGEQIENTKTVYVYDSNDVLTESDVYWMTLNPETGEKAGWSTEPSSVTTYSYDAAGKCTSKVEDQMWTTTYSYDSMGRLSKETSDAYGMVSTTVYSYDSQGRRTSATVTNQVYESEYVSNISYTYNSAGQCIKKAEKTEYEGREFNYSYDSNGNKVKETVAYGSTVGVVIDYAYEETGAGSASPFVDVQKSSEYYYTPVLWAVENGITSGTSKTTFSPNQTCTRGQVVTFLWRAAGKPIVSGSNPFVDVKESDYFYNAVLWAVSEGITKGTDSTHFSPNQKCTRGQVVTFMYRAEGTSTEESASLSAEENPFADVKTSDYFYNAVLWAVDQSITKGTSKTTFSPNQTCTRGQVVTFLYRNEEE